MNEKIKNLGMFRGMIIGLIVFVTTTSSLFLSGCRVDYCEYRYQRCLDEAGAHTVIHSGGFGPGDNDLVMYDMFFEDCMENSECGDWQPEGLDGDGRGSPAWPDGSGAEGLV